MCLPSVLLLASFCLSSLTAIKRSNFLFLLIKESLYMLVRIKHSECYVLHILCSIIQCVFKALTVEHIYKSVNFKQRAVFDACHKLCATNSNKVI